MESTSRSERVKKTWQNPERRAKQTVAMRRVWQDQSYRNRLTEHLRKISPLGNRTVQERRKAGLIQVSVETRRKESESQKRRFQRPEERKKLEKARQLSFQVLDLKERAKLMHEAFLSKYGSFAELAKMGLKAPKRRPNKLELEVAKQLGNDWLYVGKGDLVIGGLIPDFVHKYRKEVLEVLGCYFHACPRHFPNVRLSRTASLDYREAVYRRNGYEVTFLWEHDVRARRKLAFKDSGVKDPSVYAQ